MTVSRIFSTQAASCFCIWLTACVVLNNLEHHAFPDLADSMVVLKSVQLMSSLQAGLHSLLLQLGQLPLSFLCYCTQLVLLQLALLLQTLPLRLHHRPVQ